MDSCRLPVAVIKRSQGQPESSPKIEVQGVVPLKVVPLGEFNYPARGEHFEMHANIQAVRILERLLQLSGFQRPAPRRRPRVQAFP